MNIQQLKIFLVDKI